MTVIEAVTALELAIGDCIRRKTNDFAGFNSSVENRLERATLATRLLAIAATTAIGLPDLQGAVRAITSRHHAVHRGETPQPETLADIRALFRTVASLLRGPRQKFPTAERGWNSLGAPGESD